MEHMKLWENFTNDNMVYVLFETDAHKSNDSRVCMGVYTSFEMAWETFKKSVMNEDRRLSYRERLEMLGISDYDYHVSEESSIEDMLDDTDYNSAHCYIAEAKLDEFKEI